MDQCRDETDYDEEDFNVYIFLMMGQYQSRISRQLIRDKGERGHDFVTKVLHGHAERCYDLFRMEKHLFHGLYNALRSKGLLHDSKFLSVEEQLAIFLMTIGHNSRNRMMADRFQHSGETISRHFKRVLKAIVNLGKELITPPSFTDTPSEILNNPKYYPWFKDCVGAIDGTHVSASVPTKDQVPYKGRKVSLTENIMCACSFDMRFTFVYAGWEGSANDSRVFAEAITNPELHFPHPPAGKYYVVDSGYSNTLGYLVPYKGERYHLSQYSGYGRQSTGKKELFNYYHSSLRNVIERCFGVLKAKFPILKLMPSYSLRRQRQIVIVACTLHNFIRMEMQRDRHFLHFRDEGSVIEDNYGENNDNNNNNMFAPSELGTTQGRQQMARKRDEITDVLFAHHGGLEE